ncbi:UNVERIFIED_CONTAM: hypothetical protein Slati_2101900 [Sesamum latifolium]|uniref:Uncharacterized protein n=1 Tax=Sesamum latifolium TaxID=2727402 RepID=A0AAW2WTE1_9LAMI
MALAAYASLLSLAHVVDQIQHPVYRRRLHLDTEQLRGLQEKVKHLQEFLEDHSQRKSAKKWKICRGKSLSLPMKLKMSLTRT